MREQAAAHSGCVITAADGSGMLAARKAVEVQSVLEFRFTARCQTPKSEPGGARIICLIGRVGVLRCVLISLKCIEE